MAGKPYPKKKTKKNRTGVSCFFSQSNLKKKNHDGPVIFPLQQKKNNSMTGESYISFPVPEKEKEIIQPSIHPSIPLCLKSATVGERCPGPSGSSRLVLGKVFTWRGGHNTSTFNPEQKKHGARAISSPPLSKTITQKKKSVTGGRRGFLSLHTKKNIPWHLLSPSVLAPEYTPKNGLRDAQRPSGLSRQKGTSVNQVHAFIGETK